MKHIELEETGLECDNPQCDWKDHTILTENYEDYLNKPCPKCGENILTLEDYTNSVLLQEHIDRINAMSTQELEAFNAQIVQHMEQNGIDPEAFDNINVKIHDGIHFIKTQE